MPKYMVDVGQYENTLQIANLETCDWIAVSALAVEVGNGRRITRFDKSKPHIRSQVIALVRDNYREPIANVLLVKAGLIRLEDLTDEMQEYVSQAIAAD